MNEIRNLLVPIADNVESELAMDVACRLAADRGTRVAAVSVVEVPPLLPLDSHMDAEEHAAHLLLERAAAIGERYGLSVSSRIVQARDPAEAVVAQAEQRRPELIVIGSPRRNGKIPTTVAHVLRHAPCRVMVVEPAAA